MAEEDAAGSVAAVVGRDRSLNIPPPASLSGLYGVLIVIGAALLKLPFAAPDPISWSDAIFTATSAVTVTGLIVIEPGTDLTFFGQAVVLVLIQLGGLGLMSFAIVILASLGLPISLPQRFYLQQDLGQTSVSKVLALVAVIFRVVLVATAAGFVLLAFVFVPDFGWAEGLWQALFHAVSAFNNAGFSLFPHSLTDYVGDPLVNLSMTALFIVGGIGFAVLYDLLRVDGWRRYSLNTKLVIVGTVALLACSFVAFAALEWTNPKTLGALAGTGDRLWASWFQASTPRTAGFNTIPTAAMRDETTLLTILLMLIGGGPASTAGGIKVTTFMVGALATVAFFRRDTHIHAFNTSIGLDQVLKVTALITIVAGLVGSALFFLVLIEDADFLVILFEVASAFGTVGLSQGLTGELGETGRGIICVLMFAGRVGPLTLGFFLATNRPPRVRYPPGTVFLG